MAGRRSWCPRARRWRRGPQGDKPEVIFETEHDIQVIPTELAYCIAVDQRTYADRTAQANKQAPGSFAAFQGDTVRERVLYLGPRHPAGLA